MGDIFYPLDDNILKIVRKVESNVKYGVLPKTVQARLDFNIAEWTVRRYMVRIWEEGRLVRIGGRGARRGYRMLSKKERVLKREIEGAIEEILMLYPFGFNSYFLMRFLACKLIDVSETLLAGYLEDMWSRGVLREQMGVYHFVVGDAIALAG